MKPDSTYPVALPEAGAAERFVSATKKKLDALGNALTHAKHPTESEAPRLIVDTGGEQLANGL